MKIEIYSRVGMFGRRWYFRLKAGNGEVIAQSEAYNRKESAMSTAQLIAQNTQLIEVIELK